METSHTKRGQSRDSIGVAVLLCFLFFVFLLQLSKKCSEMQNTTSGKRKAKVDDPELEHFGLTKEAGRTQWPQLAITCRHLPVLFRVPPKIKFTIPGVSTEARIDVGSSYSKHAALPCRIVRPKETWKGFSWLRKTWWCKRDSLLSEKKGTGRRRVWQEEEERGSFKEETRTEK